MALRAGALLALLAAAGVFAAPILVSLYSRSQEPGEIALTRTWAQFFIPQIIIYGILAVFSAALNSKKRFVAVAWAPFANSCVLAITLVAWGRVTPDRLGGPGELSTLSIVVLGLGTDLAVASMLALVLAAWWRARSSRGDRATPEGRPPLRPLAALAGWATVSVVALQALLWSATRLTSQASLVAALAAMLTVWQLPQAILGTTVGTVIQPSIAEMNARRDRVGAARQIARASALVGYMLPPAAAALLVDGPGVAALLFEHGSATRGAVSQIGVGLQICSFGIVAASVYSVQNRALFALGCARLAALVQAASAMVGIATMLAVASIVVPRDPLAAAAAGYVAAAAFGMTVASIALRRWSGVRRRIAWVRVGKTALASLSAIGLAALARLEFQGPLGSLAVIAAAFVGYVAAAAALRLFARSQVLALFERGSGPS